MQFKNFKLIPSLTATLVALMWLGVLPVVDSVDTAFAQGPVPSGLFSRPIRSVSPDLPFETCIQGHFDLPPGPGPQGVPHFWYVRPRQTGLLTIEVFAHAVNTMAESGNITATLFDGATQIGQVVVVHPVFPATDGSENNGFIDVNVKKNKVYTLQIERQVLPGSPPGPGDPVGLREAHHYRLGFSGMPSNDGQAIDVGVGSPTFRYFEHVEQVFQINVDHSEPTVDLAVRLDDDGGAGQAQSIDLEITRRDNGGVVLSTTVTLSAPATNDSDQVVPIPNPFHNGKGTLVMEVHTDEHYRLNKQTGKDRGIYFDTCPVDAPPPPPPPPSQPDGPRTIGYWKNHPDDTAPLLPVRLGLPGSGIGVQTLGEAQAVFDSAKAKNPVDMLKAQLLATRLNIKAGVSGCPALGSLFFPEPSIVEQMVTTPSDFTRSEINAGKDVLDAFNNGSLCP